MYTSFSYINPDAALFVVDLFHRLFSKKELENQDIKSATSLLLVLTFIKPGEVVIIGLPPFLAPSLGL